MMKTFTKTIRRLLIMTCFISGYMTKAQCNANFSYSTCVNGTIQFINTSTNVSSQTYYQWNFGDNTMGWGQFPSHTYTANGTYNVCLTINDTINNCIDSICQSVTINCVNPCQPNFVDSGCVNGTKHFYSTSANTNSTTSFSWNFGDNTSGTGANPIHTYTANGIYNVCLTMINSSPSCSNTICKNVAINCTSVSACQANFTNSTCINGNMQFLNTSTGTSSQTAYSWTFGDNTTGFGPYPSHTYSANGIYTVCLTINDTLINCSSIFCKTVSINCVNPCQPNFVDSGCVNGTKNFYSTSTNTNSSTSFSWNFGDNTTGSGANPVHTYTANGVYNVCLTMVNSSPSCSNTICKNVTINCTSVSACQANFTNSTCINGNMQFLNTSTGTSSQTFYNWTFGDNTNGFGPNPAHTYSANGIYTVCLTISDTSINCNSIFCKTISINCVSSSSVCQANFTHSNCVNGTKQFYNTSTGTNSTTTYSWNFGDNTNGNGPNPAHTYSANGTYTVCLTITSSSPACNSTICKLVTINCFSSSCSANFSYSNCVNGTMQFWNTSTGTNAQTFYQWNFGDNTLGFTQNPAHTYSANGIYTVCLTISDSMSNCNSVICKTININCVSSNPCQANFSYSSCVNGTMQFYSTSTTTNITAYSWNFGDNTSGSGSSPAHTYSANGFYVVCLTIFKSAAPSCSATICKTVNINCVNSGTCQANFKDSICVNGNVQFWNLSTGTSAQTIYSWTFGDNTGGSGPNPSHTYTANGLYLVCLTISDSASNCFSTKCDSVFVGCVPTSIVNHLNSDVNLKIYPNPSSGLLNIEMDRIGQNLDNVKVTMYNILGEEVYRLSDKVNGKMMQRTVDVSQLPDGAYFVVLKGDNYLRTQKIILKK